MNIIISGIGGHMGTEVYKLCQDGDRNVSCFSGIDPNRNMGCGAVKAAQEAGIAVYESIKEMPAPPEGSCIIDFSHHSAAGELTAYAVENNVPLVIATTGQTEDELKLIKEASEKIPVFFAANYSLGIALLIELAKKTAAAFPEAEIEIIEKHHDRKLDAPSGTALAIAKAIRQVRPESVFNTGRSGYGKRTREEIGIHSVRMGNIVGEHEVIIGTQNQTITLKHEAHDRAVFAEGALTAAAFLTGRAAGLYDMKDLV